MIAEKLGIHPKIGGDNFAENTDSIYPKSILSIGLLSRYLTDPLYGHSYQPEQIHPLPTAIIGSIPGFFTGVIFSLGAPLPKNIQAGFGFAETAIGITILALQQDPLTPKIDTIGPIIGSFIASGGAATLLFSLFRENHHTIPPKK